MTKRLRWTLTRRAAREISEAAAWWKANRSKAPTAFDDEIDRALDLITTRPGFSHRAVVLAADRDSFRQRLSAQSPRWNIMGINYYRSTQIRW